MLNNAKPYFFLNEMNKKDLPAEYSTVFWCLFVVLLVFWLYCITNVTPFIISLKYTSVVIAIYYILNGRL